MKRWIVIFVIMVFSLMSTSIYAKDTDKVDMIMGFHPAFDWIPFVVGIEKGFYKDSNIDVNLFNVTGSSGIVQILANEKDKKIFGQVGGANIVTAKTKGMPIISVMTEYEKTSYAIYFRKSSGIKGIKDLEGKKAFVFTTSTRGVVLKAFLKKHNIKVQELPSSGASRESDLVLLSMGKIDLFLTSIYDYARLKQTTNDDVGYFLLNDYGFSYVYQTVCVNENMVKENPDLVKRFVSATQKAFQYCYDHPDEAVQILYSKYPQTKVFKYEDPSYGFKLSLKYLKENKNDKIGYTHAKNWEFMQNSLYENGMITNKVDVKTMFTNRFVE